MQRLLQPLLKTDGHYKPISWEEACCLVFKHSHSAQTNRTLVMANGDYSNEELYLIQRLARTGLKTNALGSFDYYKRGTSFFIDKNDIVPFAELPGASKFYIALDTESQALSQKIATGIMDVSAAIPRYQFNLPETLHIRHFGDFFRSINHYLIGHDLAKGIYIQGLGKNYERYRKQILSEDEQPLLDSNGLNSKDIVQFTEGLLHDEAPVFIIWERFLDQRGIIELENLCMLLDIQAKPSSGFLSLKAELNSQGLFDMGFFPEICVGGEPFDDGSRQLIAGLYGLPAQTVSINLPSRIAARDFDQCYLFNATRAEIQQEIVEAAESSSWSVLQTAFFEEGPCTYDLILPASLPEECDGTFTDSARAAHNSKADHKCPLPYDNIHLFSKIGEPFGLPTFNNPADIFLEYITFFHAGCHSQQRHYFR